MSYVGPLCYAYIFLGWKFSCAVYCKYIVSLESEAEKDLEVSH